MDLVLALFGHLVGDFIIQNDLMTNNKKNPHPGPEPHPGISWLSCGGVVDPESEHEKQLAEQRAWLDKMDDCRFGHVMCLVHCSLWTMSVTFFAGWSSSLATIWLFLTHFAIDRSNFISWWMGQMGQTKFRDGACSPWSSIVVDNIWHVATILVAWRWML